VSVAGQTETPSAGQPDDMTRNVSSRRITAALSLGVLTTTSLLALSVATASAAGGTVSVDFTQRGDHSWTVPQGVSQVTLWLNGAQGGSVDGDPHYGKGGLGARVYETVPVQEGQQLSIVVGGAGGEGYGGTGGGEAGGWASFHGGGGGGASRVLIGSTLVGVAGGGGGAAYGGNGGDSGHAGTSFTSRAYDGVGGGGGSTFNVGGRGSGGAPVTPHCGTAQPGFDGADGLGPKQQGIGGLGGGVDAHDRYNVWVLTGGGGGGGGYGGGGGGGGGAFCPGYFPLFGNAGGGGGGGSYVQPGLAGSSVHDGVSSGNGAVSLQFVDDDGPTAAPTVYPAPNAHGWNNTDVTVDWGWSDSVSQLDAHHCDQQAASGGATGVLDLTATCYDTLSNKGQATLQVRIDKTPPVADPLVVDGGVLWRWSDEGSYVDFQSCTTVSSVPRPAQPGVVTATCTDRAGNEATASLTTP
jgi:hypothetical protein